MPAWPKSVSVMISTALPMLSTCTEKVDVGVVRRQANYVGSEYIIDLIPIPMTIVLRVCDHWAHMDAIQHTVRADWSLYQSR